MTASVEYNPRSRLDALAALVPAGSRVADVGTDAAALPRLLLDTGRTRFCVASDVSPRALAAAARLGTPHVQAGRLELRRAEGLGALEPRDRLDVLTISGLGARTMLRILRSERLEALGWRRLVLQPQTEIHRVRRWLHDNGYAIVDELMARERGKFYVVLAAERTGDARAWQGPLELEDLCEVGPCLVRSHDRLVREYWARVLQREQRILRRCAAAQVRRRRDLARRVLRVLARGSRTRRAFGILGGCAG